jgi:hypothetical protein
MKELSGGLTILTMPELTAALSLRAPVAVGDCVEHDESINAPRDAAAHAAAAIFLILRIIQPPVKSFNYSGSFERVHLFYGYFFTGMKGRKMLTWGNTSGFDHNSPSLALPRARGGGGLGGVFTQTQGDVPGYSISLF